MERFIDYNQKLDNVLANYKKKCKCGHTRVVCPSYKRDYVICSWCGSRIYSDDKKQAAYDKKVAKNEFMYRLNKYLQESEEKDRKKRDNKMQNKRNNKKIKRRYFKSNDKYFKFCDRIDITIYSVHFTDSSIVVHYGAKLGRPKKNIASNNGRKYYGRKKR